MLFHKKFVKQWEERIQKLVEVIELVKHALKLETQKMDSKKIKFCCGKK